MNILLLSPHTDDVELGCGDSVVKFMEAGNNILWVVFSTAEESLPEDLPNDTLRQEFISVMSGLSLDKRNYEIFNFRVRDLDKHRQEILEELVKIGKEFRPDIVVARP